MNCAIAIKGTEDVYRFLLDCQIKDGVHYIGSNGDMRPVHADLWDTRWTPDVANETAPGIYDKKMSDLAPAPVYEGIIVSSRDDVDTVTRQLIAVRYSPTDETKMLRLRLEGALDQATWDGYYAFVEGVRAAGRAFKDEYFPEGTALTDAKG